MVLCLVVVALLGALLISRIEAGLLQAREGAALADAAAGARIARQQFDEADLTNPRERDQLAVDVVRRLAVGGGPAPGTEILLLAGPDVVTPGPPVDFSSSSADKDDVPTALRERVQHDQAQHYTYIAMPSPPAAPGTPGLAVGERVLLPGSGPYELYYLFPLAEEQATLDLVQRGVALAGGCLVLLVGLITYVVARQVVTPVRMAARIAERLADGRLEERMRVRGEDDLARLAASFNEMAASLQHQIRQLEELSRVQRRFVSDVSHELRTPLTTVRMAADVLHESRDDFDPAVRRSAELLQAELDRFEALLADLLEISRFDAGAASLEAEPVDVRALVERVVDAARPLAEHTGTRLILEPAAAGTDSVADVDRVRVERIVRNLVVNAIEHGEGRAVVVRVAADDEAVAVGVRDFGVGLRPGESALVFNRFWRADPARSRRTGGTGLGLSIALEDAHLHGGWLQAWGAPGRGSHFRLTVPRHAGGALRVSPLPLQAREAAPSPAGVSAAPAAAPAPLAPAPHGGAALLPAERSRG